MTSKDIELIKEMLRLQSLFLLLGAMYIESKEK